MDEGFFPDTSISEPLSIYKKAKKGKEIGLI